ncbi:MAG: hypothetical protein F6K24_21960 [Okeania sp. SIO2D1]|nr:hypothetical protein [Okeania sp. SIO2D1]
MLSVKSGSFQLSVISYQLLVALLLVISGFVVSKIWVGGGLHFINAPYWTFQLSVISY